MTLILLGMYCTNNFIESSFQSCAIRLFQAAGGAARLRRGNVSNNAIDGADLAVTDNGKRALDFTFFLKSCIWASITIRSAFCFLFSRSFSYSTQTLYQAIM